MTHSAAGEPRPIPVRVVPVTERRWGGWVGLAAGTVTFAAHTSVRNIDARAWVLQLAIALACLGSVAVWRPRARSTVARIEDDCVRIDGVRWSAGHIADASVARGEHGFSIAVQHGDQGGQPFFLEVDTEQDARALLRAWGVRWPGGATIAVEARSERARKAQRIIAGIGGLALFLGVLWQLFFSPLNERDPTYLLGPLAVLATLVSTAIFLADKWLRTRVVLGAEEAAATTPAGTGVVTRHIKAHLANRIMDDAENASANPDATGPASTPETAVRARILDKGDETTSAWLTRIDALTGGSGGYRSAAPTAQELWDVVDDGHAPVRARLAAARLLARGHRVDAGAIRARIADVGPRLRVVIDEDADAAATELDALGPLFRPRERA